LTIHRFGDSRRTPGDIALACPTTAHGPPARMSESHAGTSLEISFSFFITTQKVKIRIYYLQLTMF
ncbi:MAG: hypothetical protein U9P37_04245, partial [Pseudomonadota bacterium]|nr:hypothetical protein [Pseudomonadota bacterium]